MNAAKQIAVADAQRAYVTPELVPTEFPTEIAAEWLEPAPKRDAAPPLALWGVFPNLPPVARFEPVLEDRKPLKGRGAGQRAWR